MPHSRGIEITQVLEWNEGESRRVEDYLAGKEPLEMRSGRCWRNGCRFRDMHYSSAGRGGFEIVQKAISAGIPLLASVSAPSSVAVRLARELDLTLVGFLRGRRFIVYAGENRLTPGAKQIEIRSAR